MTRHSRLGDGWTLARMLRLAPGLEHQFERFARASALFAGMVAIVVALLMLASMVGRNLSLSGLSSWATELGSILTGWVFLVPMAFAMLSGSMIRITALVDRVSNKKLKYWLELLNPLSCILLATLLLYGSSRFLLAVGPDAYFFETHIPASVARAVVPISSSFLVCAGLVALKRHIGLGRQSRPHDGAPPG